MHAALGRVLRPKFRAIQKAVPTLQEEVEGIDDLEGRPVGTIAASTAEEVLEGDGIP